MVETLGLDLVAKKVVMIVNRSQDEDNITWRLGENELEQTCEYKYLGVCMSADGCEKMKHEKISQMNQWVGWSNGECSKDKGMQV